MVGEKDYFDWACPHSMGPRRLPSLAALLAPVHAMNIIYGGVMIKVDVPADGAVIRGSFEPLYTVEFHEGYLGKRSSRQRTREAGLLCCAGSGILDCPRLRGRLSLSLS